MDDFKINKVYECPKFIIGQYQKDDQSIFLIKDDDYVECLVFNIDTKMFYVVQQFRYGINHELNEFIGGGKTRNESAKDAMKRELREELGLRGGVNYNEDDLILVSITFLNPSVSASRAFLFILYITGEHISQDLDKYEDLLIRQCTHEQIEEFITKGITSTTTQLLWKAFNEKNS